RRADAVMEAAACENVSKAVWADIRSQGADIADQTESGKQVGFCDADLRRLRRGLELRPSDVRSTAQELRRNADGYLLRRGWDISRAGQQIIKRRGRHTEKHAESIFHLSQLNVQLRDCRFGGVKNIFRLIDIASGGRAVLELRLRDLQSSALTRDVVLGDGDLPFGGADLHVSGRHIAYQGNEYVIVTSD